MKRTPVFTAQALLGSAVLIGCAAPGPQPPEVRPVFDVRHAIAPAEAYHQLGSYYQGQGQWVRAEEAYRKAIALRPRYWEAHNGLGAMLALQGRFDAARDSFEAALAIAPEVEYLHGNLRHLERMSAGGPTVGTTPALPAEAAAVPAATDMAPPASAPSPEMPAVVVVAGTATEPTLTVVQASGVVAATAPGVYVILDATPARVSSAEAELTGAGTALPVAPLVPALAARALPVAWPSQGGPAARGTAAVPPGGGFRLEVANGNGVTGMARYVGRLLALEGLPRARLSNQKPFIVPHTRVEYRAGFEAHARALAERLPGRPTPMAAVALRPLTDVRVVLGHNLPRTLDFALQAPPLEVAAAEDLPDY